MTITPVDLLKMSQVELDKLYITSAIGEIPNGDSQGTAIVGADTPLKKPLSAFIKTIIWKGKVFYREQGFLLNKVFLFSSHLVKAQVYQGESWVDTGKEAIILDYSQSSFVAQKVRDEIRQVAPGLYLGYAFWGKTRVLEFILEF
jgi:hypothetical protein